MSLSKDLIFLILQFCKEENFTKTARMLGQESELFFDMGHIEALVLGGKWDEIENYLSGFTGVTESRYSKKMFFEIRKQKFLEALDRQDRKTALEILMKDLQVFAETNKELYAEMTQLLTFDNFREHPSLALYGDTLTARNRIMKILRVVIETNPQLNGKLHFPELTKSRLRRLINQSLNWQHAHCANPQQEPEIKTLFIDHKCSIPEDQSIMQRPGPTQTISAATPDHLVLQMPRPSKIISAATPAQSDTQMPRTSKAISAATPSQPDTQMPRPSKAISAATPAQPDTQMPRPSNTISATTPDQLIIQMPKPSETTSASNPDQSVVQMPRPSETTSASNPDQSITQMPMPSETTSASNPDQSFTQLPGPSETTSAFNPDQSFTQMPRPSKTISSANPDCQQIHYSSSSIVTDDIASASTSKAVQDSGNLSDVNTTRNMNEKVLSKTAPCQDQDASVNLSDDFPKTVERVLTIGNPPTASDYPTIRSIYPTVNYYPTTMDFHPVQQTLLIVGDGGGSVELWDVSSGKMLFRRTLMIWEVEVFSPDFLKSMGEDPRISVNRVLWNPDGSLFGVASSKNIVQLYSYHNNDNHAENHLEIEAHFGSINDLAFSKPNNQLLVITCGEDMLVKVWNANNGAKQYTFEGHKAPVYSLCPHEKEDVHFILSTSTNGEIKAWIYENSGPCVSYEAPSKCCMRMLYSANGKRLFSCGTNKDGDSHLVEWNETDGFIVRTYLGLGKCSSGVVEFDISRNNYVAAGDSHVIKFWNVNDAQLLTVVDAGGDLPASPYVRFNKNGTLLAVSVDHNSVKILANDGGRILLQTSLDASTYLSTRELAGNSLSGPANSSSIDGIVPPEMTAENLAKMEHHKILGNPSTSKVVQISRCQSLRLPSEVKTNKVCRLAYAQAGNILVALVTGGIHLIWKWSESDSNLTGQTTPKCTPQLWQPRSGVVPENSLLSSDAGAVSPCIALTNNGFYALSASGGAVSIFNINLYKIMKSITPPKPAATCIACHPTNNNVIAVGMDDLTIIVYSVRTEELISRLNGHSKRITGLAFSNTMNVLVSSGADSQIVVWNSTNWEREGSTMLQTSADWLPTEVSETSVEFQRDEKCFLVVHETQIAIYEPTKLECVKQWIIKNFCARISHATFSCDSEWIYAVMKDGIVLILSASDLSPKYEIDPSTFLTSDLSCSAHVFPVVVAAHPENPNQLALGLNDGGVVVIEPSESDGKWCEPPNATTLTNEQPI
ncbi:topless-related protein 1-like isoform X18 [Solanum lycopersicum]|uniref:topless-related protein 1-like isoform X18 n=1 Tax=Solanum lycopersicum TaxID=4081 RepID=UPI000532F4FA|nr:topless-related protein 1-like isoform X14 [Solanum lycopersicum]